MKHFLDDSYISPSHRKMHLRVCYGWFFVLICSACAASDDDPEILFRDGDRQFTVAEITGVPYREAVALVAEVESKEAHSLRRQGSILPAMRQWNGASGMDLYHHMLSGVVELYIGHQLFDQLFEAFPQAAKNPRLHFDTRPQFVEARAEKEIRFRQALLPFIQHRLDRDGFKKALLAKLPKVGDVEPFADMFEQGNAGTRVAIECFPVKNSMEEVVTWRKWHLDHTLIRYLLIAEFERDPERYRQITADVVGERTYFVIAGSFESVATECTELLRELADEKGNADISKIRIANDILRELESGIEIGVWRGSRESLRTKWGISSSVAPGTYQKCGDGPNTTVRSTVGLLTFQESADTRRVSLSTAPGTNVFSHSKEHVLIPMLQRQLLQLKIAPYVKLPSPQVIADSLGGTVLPPQMLGERLPAVVDNPE